MFFPSFQEFKKITAQGELVPVYSQFLADLETPVTLFLKVGRKAKQAFLLESAEVGEKMGRYSFVGVNPQLTIELRNGNLILRGKGRTRRIPIRKKNEVFDYLRTFVSKRRFAPNKELPPFVGGLVGYLGYEFVYYCDDVVLRKKPSLSMPDLLLFLVEDMLIYDHLKHTIQLVHIARDASKNPRRAYNHSCQILRKMEHEIKRSAAPAQALPAPALKSLHVQTNKLKKTSNLSQERFEEKVRRIKSYIRSGDCIQVVLSQRFQLDPVENDFEVYRALRSINPSPYMFYFKHGNLRLVGSSPEMLIQNKDGIAQTKPIAGTRPRGTTEKDDRKLEMNLKNSKKELAEHLMLVDLGRNDLGRVCRACSVRVASFAQVERYSHVMHLVSEVQGTLKKGKDALDLLKAAFPAGTLSGAPKIRAMQIIDELEEEARGPYGGAIGYFSFNGDMDLCIIIRTIMLHNNIPFIQAGAGIVYDSNPAKEYAETISKAKVLFQAIESSQPKSGPL